MSARIALAFLFSLCIVGCRPYVREDPFEEKMGRYQLESAGEDLFKINTVTGEVWVRQVQEDGTYGWELATGAQGQNKWKAYDFIEKTKDLSDQDFQAELRRIRKKLHSSNGH